MQNEKWSRFCARILCGAMVLGFVACNSSEPDSTPPSYTINLQQTQGKYRFGITDTIAVTFSEKIDTSALALVFTPGEGIGSRFIGGTKLLIFGKNQTYGTGHFNIPSDFSVALTGLRDTHGNGHPRIEATFFPFPWVDKDRIDSTFNGLDSLFQSPTTWMDGSAVTDSLTTEGSLDFKKLAGALDYTDLKVVSVTGGDTLFVSLTTRKDLDLKFQIAGPFSKAGLDSIVASNNILNSIVSTQQTTNTGLASAKIPADFGEYNRKFKDPGAHGLFLIFIGIPQYKEGFYRLGSRIHAFK
jgi:hypothetical protein